MTIIPVYTVAIVNASLHIVRGVNKITLLGCFLPFLGPPCLLMLFLLPWSVLLREQPQNEITIFTRLEGTGDNDVVTFLKLKPRNNFTRVGERRGPGSASIAEKKISV